jgi:hypothetical protein
MDRQIGAQPSRSLSSRDRFGSAIARRRIRQLEVVSECERVRAKTPERGGEGIMVRSLAVFIDTLLTGP